MTTFATHEKPLDERVREAWTRYRDALVGLEGREYDEAEQRSWEELQERLREIDADEALREGDGAGHPDPR